MAGSFDWNSINPWGTKAAQQPLPVAQRQAAATALAKDVPVSKQGWVPSPTEQMANAIQKKGPDAQPGSGRPRVAAKGQEAPPAPGQPPAEPGKEKGKSEDTKKALLATGLGVLGGIGQTISEALLAKEYQPAQYKAAYGGMSPGSFGANAGVPGALYRDRQAVDATRPSLAMALLGRRG